MAYPDTLDAFPTRTDGTAVMAAHINGLQSAVAAVQAELGTNPSGASETVAARLASAIVAPRWVSIKDLGADPTGAADSTSAIVAARSAAVAAGVPLYIPKGTYRITSQINLAYDDLRVEGDGPSLSILRQHTPNTSVVRVGAARGAVRGIGLTYAAQPSVTDTGAVAMEIWNAFRARWEDLGIYLSHVGIGIAQADSGSGGNPAFSYVADNISVLGWRKSALLLDSYVAASTPSHWRNVYLHNNPMGPVEESSDCAVVIQDHDGVKFDVLNIEWCSFPNGPALIANSAGATIDNLHVEGCNFSAWGAAVATAYGHSMLRIGDLEVQACAFAGTSIPMSLISYGGGSGAGQTVTAPRVILDGVRWLGGNTPPDATMTFTLARAIDVGPAAFTYRGIDPRCPFDSLVNGSSAAIDWN